MSAAANAEPVLVARGLSASFRSRQVLADVSFCAAPGEILAIAGENGSGKTTLLRILAGLSAPSAGEVERRAPVGYCPQAPLIYPRLTPDEHFRLFARALRLADAELRRRADDLLRALGFERDRHRPVHELSTGTCQKLNLALALLGDPDILLLDEPYNGFDRRSYDQLWSWLRSKRAAGKCVVMVSHLVIERDRFDRVLSLERGSLHEVVS